MTLITGACGFGDVRTGTELASISPAAGKVETIGYGGFFLGVVVVVGVVVVGVVVVGVVVVVSAPVIVVPVPPARARVGKRTAAENPATASRTEAMRTRLTD
jgi:multisubunit Na+/H+ antiporter MnhG subunit